MTSRRSRPKLPGQPGELRPGGPEVSVAEPPDKVPDNELSSLVSDLSVRVPGAPGPRQDTLEHPNVPGSLPQEHYVAYERDLSAADLGALNTAPRSVPPRALQRIHSSHHSLARCLAAGMRPGQAGLVTGYSPSRISILSRDPAFQSLVADYTAEAQSVFADLAERMHDISLDAIELLQERMQDKPGELTIPMLLEIVKVFADRTGHGPGQDVTVRVNQDFVDRPPRETFEEWQERRARELGPEMKRLN